MASSPPQPMPQTTADISSSAVIPKETRPSPAMSKTAIPTPSTAQLGIPYPPPGPLPGRATPPSVFQALPPRFPAYYPRHPRGEQWHRPSGRQPFALPPQQAPAVSPSFQPLPSPESQPAHPPPRYHPLLGVEFPTLGAATGALHDTAREAGYSIAIKKYYPSKAEVCRVTFGCSRGRKPPSQGEQRKRKRVSNVTECPWKVVVCRGFKGSDTTWFIEPIGNPEAHQHNHEMQDEAAFSRYRIGRLATKKPDIISLWKIGVNSGTILKYLQNLGDEYAAITRSDLANYIAVLKQNELAGFPSHSTVQATTPVPLPGGGGSGGDSPSAPFRTEPGGTSLG